MAITHIKITNFKSLKSIELDISDFNCLIGKNGVGKTNILNAIKYFYDNLPGKKFPTNHFDVLNAYNDKLEISITFDFNEILNRIENYSDFTNKILEIIFYQPFSNDYTIELTLTQYKDNQITWNYPYSMLKIIKDTHPAYFIDARNIDLVNWNNLWDIVGDLANTSEINLKDFSYSEVFNNTQKEIFNENIEHLRKEMESMGIQISREHGRNKIISLYQLELGGIEFTYDEKKLDFFSDGTNAGNYIRLLAYLVYRISQQKVKNPLVVIDEPEIGLHPRLIDQLIQKLSSFSEYVHFIFSTHSPRIVKNMLQNGKSFYRVRKLNQYTEIDKIPFLTNNRARRVISDNEASYYFSDKLLLVEGATELELFHHGLLYELFPHFNKVDVFSFNSDDVTLHSIHPSKMNLKIPYLLLIDIDKTFKWKRKDNYTYKVSFGKNSQYNPITNEAVSNKEHLLYKSTPYAQQLLQTRKRLMLAQENFEFNFEGMVNILSENSYEQYKILVKLINNYISNYNILSLHYTIEGALINEKTLSLFIEWFSKKGHIVQTNLQYIEDKVCNRTLVTILRSAMDGRLDNQEKFKQNQTTTCKLETAINELHRLGNSKTSGWVTDFLTYFKEVKLTDKSLPDQRVIFKQYFPELYDIINNIKLRPE